LSRVCPDQVRVWRRQHLKTPDTTAYLDLLDYLLPLYEKEGKTYMTIAAGCTGGRHRSVVIARFFYAHIARSGKPVGILHRDIANR